MVCANDWVHNGLRVASLMSLMASPVTTSQMQQCFDVLIDICHEFLLLFYWCVLLEIKLTTTTITGCVRLFAHYIVSLSLLCRLWSPKMLLRYVVSSVHLRLSHFSQLSLNQYMRRCVFSFRNAILLWWSWWCVRYIIITIIKSEMWIIKQCLW